MLEVYPDRLQKALDYLNGANVRLVPDEKPDGRVFRKEKNKPKYRWSL